MEQFTLDATQATPVIIKTRAEDGTVTEHHFEVLTLNHPRFVEFQALAKKMRTIQQKPETTAKEQLEMTSAMAAALDLRVRSTNGPVTITSLWDNGLIGLEHLRLLGERLNEEAVGPPA
jgi:hypothetical protein